MPKGGKGGKGKNDKPSWMSAEVFALSQNVPQLVDNFRGPSEKSTSPQLVSKAQAGFFLWRLLYPENKKVTAMREEAIKLECIEAAVKNMASTDVSDRSPATGVLSSLIDTEASRETLLAARPAPIPILLNNLEEGTASLVTYTCGILKILAGAVDTKPKLLRAMREWSWGPLLSALKLHKSMPMFGGNAASVHAAGALEFLLGDEPQPEEGLTASDKAAIQATREAAVEAGCVEVFVDICLFKSPTAAKASAVTALHKILQHCKQGSVRSSFLDSRGIDAMVNVLVNAFIPLGAQGAAAGCLWVILLPESKVSNDIDRDPDGSMQDGGLSQRGSQELQEMDMVDEGLELKIEAQLLDDNVKAILMERAQLLANVGGVRYLVQLCRGPDGPLPVVVKQDAGSGQDKKKDKKGKKGKKGKKKGGKLEPGMDIAQTYGTGCLRLISLREQCKEEIVHWGGIRYLAPLLDSKIHHVRWNTRQVLLNLAMVPEYASEMTLYGVPDYITGANIPRRQWAWERPFSSRSLSIGGLDEALKSADRPKTTPATVENSKLPDTL